MLNPPSEWHSTSHEGTFAFLSFLDRVLCDPNYYGSTCTKFCVPRDDWLGHYTCNQTGNKQCLPGWVGEYCDTGELASLGWLEARCVRRTGGY